MAIRPFKDLTPVELRERRIDAYATRRRRAFARDLLKMSQECAGLFRGGRVALLAQRKPLTVERGKYIVQATPAAGVIGFQHQVAERLEAEHVFHEKTERANGVRFPLARTPGMRLAESLGETLSDRGAGEQTFGRAERFAAGAGMDDPQAGVDRGGKRLNLGACENACERTAVGIFLRGMRER